jgi:alkanesulfonate monooxygenase SsuD/methylene tetrahydromethanopterin reductase-like flavin-dependent oxidoreductase (luciferase family)
MTALVSIGLPGATDPDLLAALAPRIEGLGFHGLWLNDTPDGDALRGLRVVAERTSGLALGTGVIPLDRRPADTLELAGLPADRLVLGISGGAGRGAVARLLDGVETLRAATTARIVVGALGPVLRRAAAEHTDGVLLSWLTPSAAADAMADLHRDAAGREVSGILYVRTIVDEAARPALVAEAARYEASPAYGANFERLGIHAVDATIASAERLAEYTAVVDEVVLRAITPDGTADQLEAFVERAARLLGE